jgi:high-affinity Fe2+/Pb2+ permease
VPRSGVPYYERRGVLLAGLLFFVVVDVANAAAGEWVSVVFGIVIAGLLAWRLRALRRQSTLSSTERLTSGDPQS